MPRRTIPPVQSEHESESPASSGDAHRDAQKPAEWEAKHFNNALDQVRAIKESLEEKATSLSETVHELRSNLTEAKTSEKEARERERALREELEMLRNSSRDEDDRLRNDLRLAQKDIRELADQVAKINKPTTEATARAETATVLNLQRGSETKWKALLLFLTVVLAIMQLLGVRLPDTKPNVSLPDTRPQPAGTGFAGAP